MKVHYALLFFFICFLILNNPIAANETVLVSEKTLQDKIKSVEDSKILNDENKKSLVSLYTKALNFLDTIKFNNEKSQLYNTALEHGSKEIEDLQKQLDTQENINVVQKPSDSSEKEIQSLDMFELQQKLHSEAANLAAVAAKNSALAQNIDSIQQAAPDIRKRIIEANQKLEELLQEPKISTKNINIEEENALKWVSTTHIAALRSEIKMLDKQLLSHPVRFNLLKIKKELSDHSLKKITAYVNFLSQHLNLKRASDVKKSKIITQEELLQSQGKHTLIQSLASSNSKLSLAISNKAMELSQLETRENEVNKESKRLSEAHANIKKKLEIAGLNHILGQILIEQKKMLPDSKQYIKKLKAREHLIAESGLQHINYQEELIKIKNKQEYLAELMKDLSPEIKLKIQDDMNDLLSTKRTLLEKVISIDELYLQAIGNLDYAERNLITAATNYAQIIDEHLFWLRSAPLINKEGLLQIPNQIISFLSPRKWLTFINDFINMLKSSFEIIVGLLIIALLLRKKRWLKVQLHKLGIKTKKTSIDSLTHTWKAIAFTFLLALPFPGLLLITGWQLSSMPDTSNFTNAISKGMLVIVLPLFSLQFFHYICRPDGLSKVHFKWNESVAVGLSKEMKRLMFTFLPAAFITAVLISKGESSVNDGLGRLFLMVTLLTFAIFFYRLLKPVDGILHPIANKNPKGLFARFQHLWLLLSLMLVIGLMGLTIVGYVYTAGELTGSLVYTVWFIFALVLFHQLSVRWLLLTQRRYALKMAYEKYKATQELKVEKEINKQENADSEKLSKAIDPGEPVIDIESLSEHSTQLLNLFLFIIGIAGFFVIWSDIIPAFGMFEKVELWHYNGIENGIEKLLPITLKHLSIAILIAAFTLIGAKRFPAIIEILLLQNTTITSGSRYAIITLTNYCILGFGFFSIFNILGAEWSKFQWLFAALSVGIGFGLQEIVANFISGLIILFERPIRVGDYVSVGENEGVVTRIQIRATTILTYDRKELLVPNKQFITGQLINLSLSDPTSRITIPVGIAYGSNVAKARQILLEAAIENEHILSEPEPRVLFYNFGDNSLNLQLRCYIDNIDFRMNTISDINERINDKFIAAGISISFPQRDVHLDFSQPIEIQTTSSGLSINKA